MSPDGDWQFTPVCNCYNVAINAVARLSSRLFHLLTFLAASGEINLALQLRNIEIHYYLISQGYTTATSWISKVRSLPDRGWFPSNVTSDHSIYLHNELSRCRRVLPVPFSTTFFLRRMRSCVLIKTYKQQYYTG